MEKPKIYLLKRFQQKPKKAFIVLLGVNVIREIISFLNYQEFIEFCLSCRKFVRFANDKFTQFKENVDKGLNPCDSQLIESILERKSIDFLLHDLYPWVNSEWKNFKIVYFHFTIFDSRKLIFMHTEKVVEIKEIINFITEFRPCYSREFKDTILFARGFKNKIVLACKTRIECFTVSNDEILSNEEGSFSKSFTYLIPSIEKVPIDIEFLNNSKNIVLKFQESLYVLNDKMNLLNIHRYQDKIFCFLVPNKEGKGYITYTMNEIKVYKINSSQENTYKVNIRISQVVATNVKKKACILYGNEIGEIYLLNRPDFKARCYGKFFVLKEFLIFQDITEKFRINILNLASNTVFYAVDTKIHCFSEVLHCDNYKLIYFQMGSLYLYSFINSSKYRLQIQFEEILSIKFINNLMILNVRQNSSFGILAMDLYRECTLDTYSRACLPSS